MMKNEININDGVSDNGRCLYMENTDPPNRNTSFNLYYVDVFVLFWYNNIM